MLGEDHENPRGHFFLSASQGTAFFAKNRLFQKLELGFAFDPWAWFCSSFQVGFSGEGSPFEIRKHPYPFASLGALLVDIDSTGFPGAIHAYVSAVAAGVKGSLFGFVSPPGRVPAPSRSPYYSVAYCDWVGSPWAHLPHPVLPLYCWLLPLDLEALPGLAGSR